jgi:hypothetical protein
MNANRSPEPKTVLTPTEARQGSRRFMNLRVLVVSLVLLGVLGLALTAAFVPEEEAQVEKTATETVAPAPSASCQGGAVQGVQAAGPRLSSGGRGPKSAGGAGGVRQSAGQPSSAACGATRANTGVPRSASAASVRRRSK